MSGVKNIRRRSSIGAGIAVAAAAVTLAACGSSTPNSSSGSGAQPVSASFRLDYLPSATQAPFYLALERGYYKDAGINLTILNGQGSSSTIQLIAAGKNTFGLASFATLAAAGATITNVEAVCGYLQKDPDAIISLASSPITSISDLAGKKIGYPVGSETVPWPAFVADAHVDASKVTRVGLSYADYYSAVISGKVNGIVGWAFTDGANVNQIKPIARPLLYADNGVTLMSSSLIVQKETAEQHPALVKAFVAASLRGIKAAVADPAAAAAAIAKYQPNINVALFTKELKQLPAFLTTSMAGSSYCSAPQAELQGTAAILHKYMGLPASVNVPAFYTNKFLPKS